MPWHAKPGCLEHYRIIVKRIINVLPSSYLLLPRLGELFDNLNACNNKLRGYTLIKNFDIIKYNESIKKIFSSKYKYIFYNINI